MSISDPSEVLVLFVQVGALAILSIVVLAVAGIVMGLGRRFQTVVESFDRIAHIVIDAARCPFHVSYRIAGGKWKVNDTPFGWNW